MWVKENWHGFWCSEKNKNNKNKENRTVPIYIVCVEKRSDLFWDVRCCSANLGRSHGFLTLELLAKLLEREERLENRERKSTVGVC
jgi:hypothetical protein